MYLIYNKNTLQTAGRAESEKMVEWEIARNSVPNFGGAMEDYAFIVMTKEDVEKTKTHEFTIQNGKIVFGTEKVIEAPPKEPTPEERINALEEERLGLQLALAESIEKQEIDKVNNQLALAELVETLTMKGVL